MELFGILIFYKLSTLGSGTTDEKMKQLLGEHLNEMETAQISNMPIPYRLKAFAIWLVVSPMKLRQFTRDSVINSLWLFGFKL